MKIEIIDLHIEIVTTHRIIKECSRGGKVYNKTVTRKLDKPKLYVDIRIKVDEVLWMDGEYFDGNTKYRCIWNDKNNSILVNHGHDLLDKFIVPKSLALFATKYMEA